MRGVGLALCLILAFPTRAFAQVEPTLKEIAAAVSEALAREDYSAALPWIRMGAERGDPMFQDTLGGMFESGLGVSKDLGEARRWWLLAAERGHPWSQSSLGVMLATGEGAPVDLVEAYKWFSLAVAAGHEESGQNLQAVIDVMTADEIAEGKRRVEAWRPR